MKKYFILAASAVAVLSSCSNEEISEVSVVPETSKKAIEISAYAAGATRYFASEANIESLAYNADEETGGFTLYAGYMNEGEFSYVINNSTFSANSDGSCFEIGNNQYYWPAEETEVEFFAYYPDRANNCTLSQDKTSMRISAEAERDLLAAYAKQSSGNVALNFKHLMAQVQINIAYDTLYAKTLIDGDNNRRVAFELNNLSLTAPAALNYTFSTNSIALEDGEATYTFKEDGVSYEVVDSLKNGLVGIAMIPADFPVENEGKLSAITQCTLSLSYNAIIRQNQGTSEQPSYVNLSTKTYTRTNDTDIKIAAGYLNIINIKIAGDKPISITAEVAEWNSFKDESNNPVSTDINF